jgi:hypothetical protein
MVRRVSDMTEVPSYEDQLFGNALAVSKRASFALSPVAPVISTPARAANAEDTIPQRYPRSRPHSARLYRVLSEELPLNGILLVGY